MGLTMWDRDDYERTPGVLRDRLGETRLTKERARGAALPDDEALDLARSIDDSRCLRSLRLSPPEEHERAVAAPFLARVRATEVSDTLTTRPPNRVGDGSRPITKIGVALCEIWAVHPLSEPAPSS
jgi:hypothetical protein